MNILARIEGAGRALAFAAAMCLVALLGAADYLTGYEASFAVFYLVPVAYAAWAAGERLGVLTSGVSAAVWQMSNLLAGETHTHPAVFFWNAVTRLVFFAVVAHLVARQRELLRRETRYARVDYATGALNARAFGEAVEAEACRLGRHGRPFTVAYLDVDNFKAVNDEHGHGVGDFLLRTLAATMRQSLRGTDVVARLGGDEFALLLPETDAAGGATAVGKLRESLLGRAREHGWPITFSIGVVTCLEPPRSADALLGCADELMYKVKRGRKDGVEFAVLGSGEDAAAARARRAE
jgi:diguanylate cyclase (GGDEF)-like protein